MSVHAMKPMFTDRQGYVQWRKEWKMVYNILSLEIRENKNKIAEMQASMNADLKPTISKMQAELVHKRVMAHKLMTILTEAKLRRDRILEMHEQIRKQNAQFPMTLEDCRNIDFHFNKGSLEFPFLPMWTLKARGMTFYINHIDAQIPWSTRELPEGSTRGMIRLKNGDITIDVEGNATIVQSQKVALKAVA